MSYVVDTGIFSMLADGTLQAKDLPSDESLVALPIQMVNIQQIGDKRRRTDLLLKFTLFEPKGPHSRQVALDGQIWDEMKFWDRGLLQELKSDLDAIEDAKTRLRDLLLAEIAIENHLTLLTMDDYLAEVVCAHGGAAVFWEM